MESERDPSVFARKGAKKRFDFHFIDRNGRRIYRRCPKSVTSKAAARAYARQAQQDYYRPQAPTLAEFCDGFFDFDGTWVRTQIAMDRQLSRGTARMRAGHLAKWILPAWGTRRLQPGFATPGELQAWLVDDVPLANATRNHILLTLRQVFHAAQMRGLIDSNPAELVPLFGRKPDSPDPFTVADFAVMFPQELARCLEIWLDLKRLAAFMTLASTGIRSGELRALQWLHLLEDSAALVIARGVHNDGTIGETKTRQARVVILPRRTLAVLQAWHAQTPAAAPTHLMFCGEGPAQPWHREALSGSLPGALKRAAVTTEGRRLVVHSFRHAYVSTFRRRLPEELLRALTGHRSAALEGYDHPAAAELLKANLAKLAGSRDLIEQIWGDSSSPSCGTRLQETSKNSS